MIHLYVHGRGRGHATRCLSVARALEARGHELHAFAGENVAALLSPHVRTTEVSSLPQRPTLATAPLLAHRLRAAMAACRDERPRVCIADGDLPGLLAARITGRPAVAMGHGLIFTHCERPASILRSPWWREALKARLSTPWATHYVPVSFVPLQTRRERTTLSRPSIDPNLRRRTGHGRIVCYFRDGAPDLIARLVALGESPVVFGDNGRRVAGAEYKAAERDEFLDDLIGARGVVASAGSQLIAECVALGLPILALHGAEDDEQRLNAAMVLSFGLGDGCAFAALSTARLRRFVRDPPKPKNLAFEAPDVASAVANLVTGIVAGM